MQDGAAASQSTEEPSNKKARQEPKPYAWCKYCQRYLYGPVQVEDHLQGKLHRNRKKLFCTEFSNNGIQVLDDQA